MATTKNVVQKFRTFWNRLNSKDQDTLWNILTALRGDDSETPNLKWLTIARIRFGLLGDKSQARKGIIGYDFNNSDLNDLQIKERDKLLQNAEPHFRIHVKYGLQSLVELKCLPKEEDYHY